MTRIRVLVIDDSAYNRRTISKILEGLPEVQVIGYASDGEEGMRKVLDLEPDLITLDLEMPKIDGFTLLRFIMARKPTPVIVVSSRSGSEGVFKALDLGAIDFVVKPGAEISTELQSIRRDLEEKVRNVYSLNISRLKARGVVTSSPEEGRQADAGKVAAKTFGGIDIVAIGASTGGPPALQGILSDLPHDFPAAIVVSQHMPASFTRSFADRLNKLSGLRVVEAQQGERVEAGKVLIAPGGHNMLFERRGDSVVAKIVAPTPEYRYVPSVDAMFESCAAVYGSRVLGVVLTGMGNDGRKGVCAIKAGRGTIYAESEETSIVYGMPREAVATGLVDKVVPLGMMSRDIQTACWRNQDYLSEPIREC